jgi:diguanylate cyclase (GGDEF)-like protein
VAEAVVFLFGAEAAVVLTLNRDSQGLRPLATAGRPLWEGLRLQGQHEAVREALQKGEAVALTEPLKLRQMGLPEEVLSLHLFALSAQPAALLAALNCPLSGEALQCVQELCRLAEHLFRAAYKSWQHRRASTVLRGLSHKASALSGLYQEPQRLYQQVVEEAAALLGARRCSLMLPERTGALKVVAVKGMNPHLLQDVQVRIGEAIAGRVFKEQSPLLLKEPQEFRHLGAELKPMFRTSSCLSIPLSIGQEPLGVLNLADKASGQAFNRADLELLGPFSQQVALLLKLSLCYQGWMQMKELSFTDALTGLYNRRYFDMRLREEHQRARRHGLQLSLALMDIDDFKLFNDTEGHLAGDRMLKEIASIIQSTIRVNDIAVRFGGEEFALLMPQTSKAKALKVAERLRSNIRRLTQQGWRKYPKEALTISIGVATFPECGPEPQGLIRCADKALYMAKAQGKDRTVPWHCSPQGTEQMLQRLP